MEPAEIAALAEQREAIFAGLPRDNRVGHARRVTVANAPASRCSPCPTTLSGSLDELAILVGCVTC